MLCVNKSGAGAERAVRGLPCRLAATLGALTSQEEELAHEGFDSVGWVCLLRDV